MRCKGKYEQNRPVFRVFLTGRGRKPHFTGFPRILRPARAAGGLRERPPALFFSIRNTTCPPLAGRERGAPRRTASAEARRRWPLPRLPRERVWLRNTATVPLAATMWASFRKPEASTRLCRPSPLSPNADWSSSRGTSAAAESTINRSTAAEPASLQAISMACSADSGCAKGISETRTPRLAAYGASKTCSASIHWRISALSFRNWRAFRGPGRCARLCS
jgi:hypothetical protein